MADPGPSKRKLPSWVSQPAVRQTRSKLHPRQERVHHIKQKSLLRRLASHSQPPSSEDPLCSLMPDGNTRLLAIGRESSCDRRKRILPSSLDAHSYASTETHSSDTSWDTLKMLDGSALKEESSLAEGLMSVTLLKHQRVALAWMERMEANAELSGGILADDQGLGKTIEMIALILKAKPVRCKATQDQREHFVGELYTKSGSMHNWIGGTLIVCPTSVLKQWEQEIRGKVTEAAGISVLVYHGSNRTRDPVELAKCDIVITTYAIVALEIPKNLVSRNHLQKSALAGGSIKTASIHKKSKTLQSGDTSVCSPINNSGGPLFKVFWFRLVLDEAQNIKNPRTRLANACCLLRAEKRWCLSGTPVQNAVDDLYSYFKFLNYIPYADYKSFQLKIKDPLAEDPQLGFRNLQHVLGRIMLRRTKQTMIDGMPILSLPRKIVNLKQIDFSPIEREFYIYLEDDYRNKFQAYARMGSVQKNYVNILSMLLRLRQACDHPRLVQDRTKYLQKHEKNKLLLCQEKRQHLLSKLESNLDVCCICMDVPEDAVISECAHVFCRHCISQELGHDDYICCPSSNCDSILKLQSLYSLSLLKPAALGITVKTRGYPVSSLMESNKSSKIDAVIKTLLALPVVTDIGEEHDASFRRHRQKALVFSQWTRMLDLLEISLEREEIGYRRLDGTMSTQARDQALSDFKTRPEVTVMLMSLKAASLGLNMIEASHVLLVDVWWNPSTEEQAIDRTHRIGQKNPVHVTRFTVRNTIEDRILTLQECKRQMVASAFGETSQTLRLTENEIDFLFQSSGCSQTAS